MTGGGRIGKESIPGFTSTLAGFIVNTRASDIPVDVFEHAKIAFLDWLGCAIAGARDPVVEKLIRYADVMGGEAQATIIGRGVQKTVSQAALINGAASHVLDYDDTSTGYIGHPSVGMFPALLALSEWRGMSGREFLTSAVIAYKVASVIGACVGKEQYDAGWHTTSTIGHIASAAGCARLLGLDERQTVYSLGLAGTMSSGLKIVFGTMTKAFHAGNACRGGLTAALLARDDFTCAPDFMEGNMGYIHAYKGRIDGKKTDTLGKTWGFEELAPKFHASCHFTHSAIESLLKVVAEEKLSPSDIRRVYVHVSRLALDAAGKKEPKTALEGKFSIPYCLANALLRGDTGLQSFTDVKVNDPEVKSFMEKISLSLDERLAPMEARITLETNAGAAYGRSSDVFREIPALEIKRVRIINKFLAICEPLPREDVRRIVDAVLALERMKSMDHLFSLF
jgi:2-methylcitrate dehydratase PrpD